MCVSGKKIEAKMWCSVWLLYFYIVERRCFSLTKVSILIITNFEAKIYKGEKKAEIYLRVVVWWILVLQ